MKTVTAYQAEDGSLHTCRKRATAADLVKVLPKEFSFTTALAILENARVVRAVLDQLEAKDD